MQEYTPERLRHLELLAEKYPSALAAYSEIIRLEALLRLPKGTEHFMSDLHGEHEAFIHILNSASGVIREKIDLLLGDTVSAQERADLATLIYYPAEKLPELKSRHDDLDGWYKRVLLQLIDLCRLVSSKHTRRHVRAVLPKECGHILDELLHAHFEDHNKDLYYGEIIAGMIRCGMADQYIAALCGVIKRLAVDQLHIVGDLFDRGPRPDMILETLYAYHDVDFQWGNHDVVWMGAAAGSPLCILTVLKTTLAYNNVDTLERGYGIPLRCLEHYAEEYYSESDLTRWMPHADPNATDTRPVNLTRVARMHKAVTVLMFKLESAVIARNPDFNMQERDYLHKIDFARGTVRCGENEYPLLDCDFPTVQPEAPEKLIPREEDIISALVRDFKNSEKLQKHVQFLYSQGSVYHCVNGNLLYHGAVPMNEDGSFASVRFWDADYSGKRWFDCCDRCARMGYFAPEGSWQRQVGQDFLWYLWCGAMSPIYGRSAMTTFERLYISDPATHAEIKNPYYRLINDAAVVDRILSEFGLNHEGCHIVNGHVPVRTIEGENPVKGGGKLIVIDGGFCSAYHQRTGIAGYTLVFNSHGMTLRTHQPFESVDKAIHEDEDIASSSERIYTAPRRILIGDTDEGQEHRAVIEDLQALAEAYANGLIREQ